MRSAVRSFHVGRSSDTRAAVNVVGIAKEQSSSTELTLKANPITPKRTSQRLFRSKMSIIFLENFWRDEASRTEHSICALRAIQITLAPVATAITPTPRNIQPMVPVATIAEISENPRRYAKRAAK